MSYTLSTPPTSPYTGNITINTGWYNGTSATNYTWAATGTSPVTLNQTPTLRLEGEDADVIINGESLSETLKAIKDALRIPSNLSQNTKLEKEWDELKEAADHYNKLLAEYKEKQKVWDILKDKNL